MTRRTVVSACRLLPAPRSTLRRRFGRTATGRRPPPEPRPRPLLPSSAVTKSSSVSSTLPVGVVLPRQPFAAGIDVERAFRDLGHWIPFAWLSMETTRSRRPLKTSARSGMKVLRSVERFDRRPLTDAGGVRGRLRLDFAHGVDQFDRPRAIADPPAGHGIGLGHAVHSQCTVVTAPARPGRGLRT